MAQQMLLHQPDLLQNISIKQTAYECVRSACKHVPRYMVDKTKNLVLPELPRKLLVPVLYKVLQILTKVQAILHEKQISIRGPYIHNAKNAEKMAAKLGSLNKYFTHKRGELKFHPFSNWHLNRHLDDAYSALIKSEDRPKLLAHMIKEYEWWKSSMFELSNYQYQARQEMRYLYLRYGDRKCKLNAILRSIKLDEKCAISNPVMESEKRK